ncbi:MAG: hypothetical protein EBS59_06665, partial [Verrucomicrobia bacterium]|nr:hypothetical protein [Verrucomicrobiota bacterium]
SVQFSLEPTATPNNYVFSLPEEVDQEKTAVYTSNDVGTNQHSENTVLPDVDTIAQEIENMGSKKTGKGKKKGKGKK